MSACALGAYIVVLRKDAGLTQEGLARALGIASKTVSDWERGISTPESLTLRRLADVIRASWEDMGRLLGGDVAAEEGTAAARAWIARRASSEAATAIADAAAAPDAQAIADQLEALARQIRSGRG